MMKKYSFRDTFENTKISFYVGPPVQLGSDFPVHIHDFCELVIITQGEGQHLIGEELYWVKSGDVYVIKGNIPHGFRNVKGLELYNVMYIPEKLFVQQSELKKMAGFQALFLLEPFYRQEHKFQSKLILMGDELSYVIELLSTIIQENSDKQSGYVSLMKSYLTILFVYLSRKYKLKNSSFSRKILKIAEGIIYIENNYTQGIKVDEIAEKANLSRRHFSRVFKENYNLSPYEYIINLRLKDACELLKSTELSITRISIASGFSDPNYFSRHFKNKMGFTPTEYRQKYGI